MKQKLSNLALAAFLVIAVTFTARAANDIRTEVELTIAKFKQADPGLQTFFDNSAGYAVFPGVGKGGFIIGGQRGKGLVYEQGRVVGEATLTEANIGAQVGGESFDQVIFFETPGVLQEFKQGKFVMSADANAVAATAGAEKMAKYQQGVAVFTLPRKGLMVQATVGGQKFKFTPLIQP
jgi:lipid-binding SYLF domain-containing protein